MLLAMCPVAWAEIVEVEGRPGVYTSQPFRPGFAVLDRGATWFYGLQNSVADEPALATFPEHPLQGSVTVPVFLIDWSDFDPTVDESNRGNPNSVFPSYTKATREEIDTYLNGDGGVREYFSVISGGQLDVHFDVHPWFVSGGDSYLQDKQPRYYYFSSVSGRWETNRADFARDVLRAAVADYGIDLTHYDADGNDVMDGFIVVYEGYAGKLAGTNSPMTNGGRIGSPYHSPTFDNVAELVSPDSPDYETFQDQPILFNRYVNMPEMSFGGKGTPSSPTALAIWVHEVGHLLMGYRDYYVGATDLGVYALSARTGLGVPFQAAAWEKWLFGQWFESTNVFRANRYELASHHLGRDMGYSDGESYMLRVPIAGDPYHYLTFEYRNFETDMSSNGPLFNHDWNAISPESGIVVFEVNERVFGSDQVRWLLPDRPGEGVSAQRGGAFRNGDRLDFRIGDFHMVASGFQDLGTRGAVEIEFPGRLDMTLYPSMTSLSYSVTSDRDYIVEATTELGSGVWTPLPGAPHNLGSLQVPRVEGTGMQFFRLVTRAR